MRAAAVPADRERDYRLPSKPPRGDVVGLARAAPVVASFAQGSRLPLGFLAAAVAAALGPPWTAAAAARAVRDVAERKAYGAKPRQHGSRDEDANDASLWRWEVRDVDATFAPPAAAAVRACRASRMAEGKLYRQLKKVVDALSRGDAARAHAEEDALAVLRRGRENQAARVAALAPRGAAAPPPPAPAPAAPARRDGTLFERILEARGEAPPPRGAPSPYAGGAPYAGGPAPLYGAPPPRGYYAGPPPPAPTLTGATPGVGLRPIDVAALRVAR